MRPLFARPHIWSYFRLSVFFSQLYPAAMTKCNSIIALFYVLVWKIFEYWRILGGLAFELRLFDASNSGLQRK